MGHGGDGFGAELGDHDSGSTEADAGIERLLDERGSIVELARGAIVFSPTRPPAAFLVVDAGVVRVQVGAANGREAVLYRVRAGQICLLTTTHLLTGLRHAATGIAETAVRTRALAPREFRRAFDESPTFREWVLRAQGARLADLIGIVEASILDSVDVRLARLLALHAPVASLTHADIAREVATSREVISRRLGEFARRGWIEQERGRIRILDLAALGSCIGA